MYLLSPEGETVFVIPGVEIVHTLPANIKLPFGKEKITKLEMEGKQGKMQPPTLQQGGRKRQNLTLDLNSASSKKSRVQNLLTSPDVQMLKLTSPELEKFLNQNPTLATPTPTGYIFPKSVTEEQVMYAKGFEEALEHLRSAESTHTPQSLTGTTNEAANAAAASTLASLSNVAASTLASMKTVNPTPLTVPQPPARLPLPPATVPLPVILPPSVLPSGPSSRPGSGASGSYESESYSMGDGLKIKDEPSDDASLSGGEDYMNYGSLGTNLSPIDMEDQEKIKLERKRLRNRLAATKCRKRKLERISHLDERVKGLKTENSDLVAVVKKLKQSVALLKQEVIEHVNQGCEMLMSESTSFVNS
jgi:transcription factor AP-1